MTNTTRGLGIEVTAAPLPSVLTPAFALHPKNQTSSLKNKCDHLNEAYQIAVKAIGASRGTVNYTVNHVFPTFERVDVTLKLPIQMKVNDLYFPVVLLYKAVLNFGSMDEIFNCGHSNESY